MKTTFSILILSTIIYTGCQKVILTPNERGVIWHPLKGYLDTINVLSNEVNTLGIGATVTVYDISEKKEEICTHWHHQL